VQAPRGAAEIKVTTRLVLLNVLVHDRSGRPVDSLSKTDFEVTDAGRPQTIALFSVDQLAPGSAGAPPTTTLPRNIVTNRPVGQVGVPASVTVVLVDTYNTKLTDQGYANRQLIQFLKKVRPGDRIAIYTLNSNGFAIVHDFTSNAESLRAAIAKTAPRPSHELEGTAFDPAKYHERPDRRDA
jgi:VWFA-related protein